SGRLRPPLVFDIDAEQGFAIIDVDPNGALDVATVTGTVVNDGRGGFTVQERDAIIVNSDAYFGSGIEVADLNGDNFLDIVSRRSVSDGIQTTYSNASDGFELPQTFALRESTQPSPLATGDINGDGIDDLIQFNSSGGHHRFLSSPGSPHQELSYSTPFAVTDAYIGTFDANSLRRDLVMATGTNIFVAPGDGRGSFGVLQPQGIPADLVERGYFGGFNHGLAALEVDASSLASNRHILRLTSGQLDSTLRTEFTF
ncbi:unnamed protein product, partial [marine sediment metagenome]